MTQVQRDVYMFLLMAGREDEATAYRDKVEAASYDSARARANANTNYVDKHGQKIEADMLISIGGEEPELVLLCGGRQPRRECVESRVLRGPSRGPSRVLSAQRIRERRY